MDRPRKSLRNKNNYIFPDDTGKEYLKSLIIVIIFFVISLISTFGRGWGIKYFWQDFIAIFLIMSSAYKMFRYEHFIRIFGSYDIFALKWKPWAYIYPFVELILGANLLLTNGSALMYFLVAAFCFVTSYSVIKQRSKHLQAMFACLDNTVRLPISLISVFESVIIITVAVYLLIFF
jgi:hypothetical protein